MENKLKSVFSSVAFYALLAVCLAAVGVCGYFLLLGREAEEPSLSQPQAPASSSVTDLYVPEQPEPEPEPELPEQPVETAAPEPVEVAIVPTMPEADVDDTPVEAVAPQLIVSPLNGEVLMAFSVDQLVYSPTLADWRTHDGVDISAKPGTTVLAASAGTVAAVEDDPLMGTTVTIEHEGGYTTIYANLQTTPTVEPGDFVTAGQIIGAVGATAAVEAAQSPHLHFAVTKDGEAVDPGQFLKQ